MSKIMSSLNEERKEKQNTIEHLELEISSLDQRCVLIIKEKKYIENLILK